MFISILGRQPKIGLAELESLYGANKVRPINPQAAFLDVDNVDFKRLGGTLKLASYIGQIDSNQWSTVSKKLIKLLPELTANMPDGKIKIGISVIGIQTSVQSLLHTGLELKKAARALGRSARVVPNNDLSLNSAQVLRNKLTAELGIEIILIGHGSQTLVARTVNVQDVDDYSNRDFARPMRDAFVGMLPPKLAQTMLNMAGTTRNQLILDPFCGTGVVLQEAALMGCRVYGTDLSDKMIEYTTKNLEWLQSSYSLNMSTLLQAGDATTFNWSPQPDHVVTEVYLGQPLSGLPDPQKLHEIMNNCNKITEEFLKNIHKQLAKGSLHCIAVPAWRAGNNFKHLKLLDHLEKLGYNRIKLKHASWEDLIYHREDQIVARELLVMKVK